MQALIPSILQLDIYNVNFRGYTCMESAAGHISLFSCWSTLKNREILKWSFQYRYTTCFNSIQAYLEAKRHSKAVSYFLNPIINKGWEVKNLCLRWNGSAGDLFVKHFPGNASRRWGQAYLWPDGGTGRLHCMVAGLFALKMCKLFFFRLLSEKDINVETVHNTFVYEKVRAFERVLKHC